MPVMPVNAAGWRIEPPVSLPVAAGVRRAATAAAEPPEEPPGTALISHGFLTAPKKECSFDEPIANSSILVFPMQTMPASASFSTMVASTGLMYGDNIFDAAVVFQWHVTKLSLWAMGMPVSGPATPDEISASARAACASVCSGLR